MSGQLGGLTPGSFILECRAEEGFNLVARETIIITGDFPPGFNGFPGAAGGNLGGQRLVDADDVFGDDVRITDIVLTELGSQTLLIDIIRGLCSDNDPMTVDTDEPFTFNDYILSIQNGSTEPLDVVTVTISIPSLGASATQQFGIDLPAESEGTLQGRFTDSPGGVKQLAGTGITLTAGTHDVFFTVVLSKALTGELVTISDGQTFTFDNVDNCGM